MLLLVAQRFLEPSKEVRIARSRAGNLRAIDGNGTLLACMIHAQDALHYSVCVA